MPSGPPGYSQVANQGRTESNTGQGWSMPSAPPNYSDLTNGGSGMGPPPMAPNMANPSDNPDLPPPSYEDAMKNTGKVIDPRIFYYIYILISFEKILSNCPYLYISDASGNTTSK